MVEVGGTRIEAVAVGLSSVVEEAPLDVLSVVDVVSVGDAVSVLEVVEVVEVTEVVEREPGEPTPVVDVGTVRIGSSTVCGRSTDA